ncbi:MAG TPA: DUF749 family protein [Methanomassiliicoccales archaeon]|nr:DUF749 family protein [Methanomassiliicoccales archaeon]HNX46963.1 DUF749 family protein [Methanomassiliicoccales archaeon]HPR97739.1 DUF749 family protein [Methanomassiliicoccales archaeon]
MEQAHLVGVYTQEEMPEELEGFVRYQAVCDGHQMKAGERIAVLNVTGTSSYVPVFMADLKGYDDLESRLSKHGVQADQVSALSLRRVLQEMGHS